MNVIEQAKQYALANYENMDFFVEGFEQAEWTEYVGSLSWDEVRSKMKRHSIQRAEHIADITNQ